NVLARFTESPGKATRNAVGEWVKEYWMEGSRRARNHRRYTQLPELFFEEGAGGYVPHAGSIYDKLPVLLQMVRAALATTGCRTPRLYRPKCCVECAHCTCSRCTKALCSGVANP